MNEIILALIYVIVALTAVYDLLRGRKADKKGFIKTILAVILTVGFGFYVPIHKYDEFKKRDTKYQLNTPITN